MIYDIFGYITFVYSILTLFHFIAYQYILRDTKKSNLIEEKKVKTYFRFVIFENYFRTNLVKFFLDSDISLKKISGDRFWQPCFGVRDCATDVDTSDDEVFPLERNCGKRSFGNSIKNFRTVLEIFDDLDQSFFRQLFPQPVAFVLD